MLSARIDAVDCKRVRILNAAFRGAIAQQIAQHETGNLL